MSKFCFFISLFLATRLFSEEVTVDLKNPTYKGKLLVTEEGGVIQANRLRIQAREFSYSHEASAHVVEAKGDLLIAYHHKFFVGDSFSYNFETKEGTIKNGVCMIDNFFTGGKNIYIHADGSIEVEDAFFTTTETNPPYWQAKAKHVSVDNRTTLKANHLTLQIQKVPVFWFPSYSTTIKKEFKREPVVSYRLLLENRQDPLVILRTKIWDRYGAKIYVRGEARLRFGTNWSNFFGAENLNGTSGGGALEVDYKAPERNIQFQTNNFYAYDTLYNSPDPNAIGNRYRLQGLYKGLNDAKNIETFARWDKLSDRYMRRDFPTTLFEVATLERTEAFIKARFDPVFSSLYTRPRLNNFRGFKQELPTAIFAVKPYNIGNTNAVLENYFKLAYLEYSYASTIGPVVQDFGSARLETKQRLFYPLPFRYFQITPEVGLSAIYYSNNQNNKDAAQLTANYSVDVHTSIEKSFANLKHIATPYATYSGLSKPTSPIGNHYIFGIEDGYNRLNQFRYGLKNDFFTTNTYQLLPRYSADLFAYTFLETASFTKPLNKVFLDLVLNYPRMSFNTNFSYNVQADSIDHANFSLAYTINEYFSLFGAIKHRSKYDWKKNNHENYILDVSRTIPELLASPLSDQRNILHAKAECRIAPFWTLQVENYLGKRPNEPFYQQTKLTLDTIVNNTWKLSASYLFTTGKDSKFGFNASLI